MTSVAGDEQEQPEVEGDRGDQLERADRGRPCSPGAREVRERRVAEHAPGRSRRRARPAARRRRSRARGGGPAGSRSARSAPERDVAQGDRQRDDHAGAEAVADVGVALDDDRRGEHERRARAGAGRRPSMIGLTSVLPRRSRLATPTTATASTVISTIVSRPRKSARMTVTTSPPCASGVRRMCSAASLRAALGRESAAQIVANALTPGDDARPRRCAAPRAGARA